MFLGGWKGHCHRAAVQEGAAVTGRGCHNHRHRLHTLQSSPLDSSSATEELLNKRRRMRRRRRRTSRNCIHLWEIPSSTYRGTIASRSISLANNILYSLHSGGAQIFVGCCWGCSLHGEADQPGARRPPRRPIGLCRKSRGPTSELFIIMSIASHGASYLPVSAKVIIYFWLIGTLPHTNNPTNIKIRSSKMNVALVFISDHERSSSSMDHWLQKDKDQKILMILRKCVHFTWYTRELAALPTSTFKKKSESASTSTSTTSTTSTSHQQHRHQYTNQQQVGVFKYQLQTELKSNILIG